MAENEHENQQIREEHPAEPFGTAERMDPADFREKERAGETCEEREDLETEEITEHSGEERAEEIPAETGLEEDIPEDPEEEAPESLEEEIPEEELTHLYPLLKAFPPEEERTPEQSVAHALSLGEMAERMLRNDYKAKYFRKAMAELKPLADSIPEAQKGFKKYRKKMYNARARFRAESYKKACKLEKKAKTEDDFRVAAEAFEAAVRYEKKHRLKEKYTSPKLFEKAEQCTDTAERAEFCRKRQAEIRKRAVYCRRGILAALAVLAVGLFLFSRTPQYMRLKGDVERAAGIPEKAWQAYYENYRVTRNPDVYAAYQDSRYKAAVSTKDSEEPEKSWKDWEEMAKKDYLDSRKQFTDLERLLIEKAVPGNTVTFGGKEWTVLDSEGSQRLLIRKEAIAEIPFQEGGGACTWGTSSVREYLNGEYLENNFSAEELSLLAQREILPEDNRLSGNSGGEATTDRMYLLSASEAERYSSHFGETKRCWWLRTPGTLPGTMAFVNTDKTVMEYGYDAASAKIRIKPCIWIETAVPQE